MLWRMFGGLLEWIRRVGTKCVSQGTVVVMVATTLGSLSAVRVVAAGARGSMRAAAVSSVQVACVARAHPVRERPSAVKHAGRHEREVLLQRECRHENYGRGSGRQSSRRVLPSGRRRGFSIGKAFLLGCSCVVCGACCICGTHGSQSRKVMCNEEMVLSKVSRMFPC